MDVFRVRLNCVDHYQATPTEFDPKVPIKDRKGQQELAPRVPVIRVFGATETGQKVCVHIHGALPYLFVKYNGSLTIEYGEFPVCNVDRFVLTSSSVETYIHQLHLSIDHALAVSYRRNLFDGNTAFVAHITLVKGVPFYGYHVGYDFFLKIYMLNPLHMTRLADLLRQGAIMKCVMQPYESHMQYLAQWMCDFNLYGCAYIDCSQVKFRAPVPNYLDMNSSTHRWHDRTIDPSLVIDPESLSRQSHCSLEVDIMVQHILNRLAVEPRPMHHDFIERKTPLVPSQKLVQSMASLWQDETRRRKSRMGQTDPGSSPFPPEVLVSVSADPRNSQPGGWIHEREYAEKIHAIREDEEEKSDGRVLDYDSFVMKNPFETQVKSSLESVEDLFPHNLHQSTPSSHDALSTHNEVQVDKSEVPQVDERRLQSYEEIDYPYESDEELAQELDLSQRKREQRESELFEAADKEDDRLFDGVKEVIVKRCCTPDENQRNHSADRKSKCMDSSAELESNGVRKLGDYSHIEDDAFAIPSDCTSYISAPVPIEPTVERPIEEDRRTPGTESRASRELDGIRDEDNTSDDPLNTSGAADGDPSILRTGTNHTTLQPNGDQQERGNTKRGYATLSSSSQDYANGNRTLAFPVVKNPQDPQTVLRLSQTSNPSAKGSQKAKIKSTSSPSGGPDSSSLGDPKRTSLASLIPSKGLSSQIATCGFKVHGIFGIPTTAKILCFKRPPLPSSDTVLGLQTSRLPSAIHQDAHYSDEHDVPERPREYAGKEFKLEGVTIPFLPEFDPTGMSPASRGQKLGVAIDKSSLEITVRRKQGTCAMRTWEIGLLPPTKKEVEDSQWNSVSASSPDHPPRQNNNMPTTVRDLSQVEGPTQRNRQGFKYSQKQKSTSVQHETQYMSLMSSEIHANTRGRLIPNPEQDRIECIFWCLQSEDEDLEVNGSNEGTHIGILLLSEDEDLAQKVAQHTTVEVEQEASELDLIMRMVDIVRHHDPDILTGYEVHGGSWGYMIERARHQYDYNLCDEFSRMKSQSHGRFGKEDDRWGFNHTSTIRVTGRHMINIWRAMRGELNLLQYTMENVVFQLCHRRIPHYSYEDLTMWYARGSPRDLAKVVDYYVSRVQLDLEILEQNELVPRTSEQARLLGVDFFSVFSRGSQFKVESLMFRIAKPENFLLPSPSRKQVGQQNALECLPLVMEPQSAFYNSPLLVLDFQSLYPSVMIAYNYCYSTFLGRVVNWRGQNKMGFTNYERESRLLELLKDHINIAPNGIIYTRPEIRKSLLAKMLGEILETRVMVKSGMKVDKHDKTLQRLLNNRQLALKLIANVTYGYTSASFSGRMPCSEIADSIVQTGRETLEKAIALIHSVGRWSAEVVYGDTDSLFVYLKGRTKDEAFDIGQEIANTITQMNPRPVKLKFEKVYYPSVLLAKKRYVGFKYESKSQEVPDFDAKGIETVRRDGTPAEHKIEEKALKILFRTADLSQVKQYFQSQCSKIMKGKVSIQDFCFAKEVKLGTYSDKGLPPPGALISTKRMLEDPRAEPQYGERVPYVVITGAPGARLIDRCVAPDVLLHNDNNELDAEYYISKNLIPPLERIFCLMGANVRQWYDEMPKQQRIRRVEAGLLSRANDIATLKKTLESYLKSSTCIVCQDKLEDELSPICARCMSCTDKSSWVLRTRLNSAERKAINLERVCRSCSGLAWGEDVKCDSKDCPVFYTRTRHMAQYRSFKSITEPALGMLKGAKAGALNW